MQRPVVLLVCLSANSALAQEPGWAYSPLPGEGDRAAMGCTSASNTQDFACFAVRCEDDFSIGLYLHTSRPEGDVGPWDITVDKETRPFQALPTATAYGARLNDQDGWLLDGVRAGAVAYLQPSQGNSFGASLMTLNGSLDAINRALAFCAPKVPATQ